MSQNTQLRPLSSFGKNEMRLRGDGGSTDMSSRSPERQLKSNDGDHPVAAKQP